MVIDLGFQPTHFYVESQFFFNKNHFTKIYPIVLRDKKICFKFFFHRKLGLDLVPRIGPLTVNCQDISVSSLHQVHVNSSENAKASSVS